MTRAPRPSSSRCRPWPSARRSGRPPPHLTPRPRPARPRPAHALSACPGCRGPVRPCRGPRTRVIEDIPADITPVVTEHTIHRSWCPSCRAHVEPTVPDALPGSSIGLRAVVLSAWLHYLPATPLAQIVDVFNFYLHFPLSPGGLV
jgi:transposase